MPVFAAAVGPLFLGPLSEVYGRVIVLQIANMTFLGTKTYRQMPHISNGVTD